MGGLWLVALLDLKRERLESIPKGWGEGRGWRGVSLGNPHKGQRESRLASFWPARDKGNGKGAKHCLFYWAASLSAPNYVSPHLAKADNDEGQRTQTLRICLLLIIIYLNC